jgi:hypothetical protein
MDLKIFDIEKPNCLIIIKEIKTQNKNIIYNGIEYDSSSNIKNFNWTININDLKIINQINNKISNINIYKFLKLLEEKKLSIESCEHPTHFWVVF